MYPVVDEARCIGCGNCVKICPSEVYVLQGEKSSPVHLGDCIECRACVNQCPEQSIRLCED